MKKGNKKGAALLTVLIAMMIITIIILEFQYSAIVERQLAYNDLQQLQAYYLAKSGAHVGLLRVSLYGRALKDSGSISKNFGNLNIKPYLDLIWSLPVPSFPPEKGSLGKLLKADKDAAEKTLSQTQITDGQYSHVITSESSKINLNYLSVPKGMAERPNLNPPAKTLFEHVGILLLNLVENFLKDSPDPYEEFGNLRPEELVFDIMDWVSPGDVRLAGGAKDAFYEQQTPPYKAKRNRFYTLDELKMVRGIDDYLFSRLRPYVTVYSYDGKININSAADNVLRALYRDFNEDDLKRLNEEKVKRGGAWASEKDFVDYITQTLGRSGFTTQYPNAAEYPFTVSSQSFVIESLGVIKKSKSQVTRMIRVGVALRNTTNSGKSVANTQDECGRLGNEYFWRQSLNGCYRKPSTREECATTGSSQWDEATKTCMVPEFGGALAITFPGATPGAGAAKSTAATPNAMKVLYWTES